MKRHSLAKQDDAMKAQANVAVIPPTSSNGTASAPYLKLAKITSFGAFTNEVVGPFSPHLNIVFGTNESGKTTLASFVGGVLFGWEEARGGRNTYKPENAERSGSLFFANDRAIWDESLATDADGAREKPEAAAEEPGANDETELSRTKNAEGLRGDASLVADIDKETFRTMFSLTSDELRSLHNTPDVTAKLLTAGSGTGASPAHALADVQARLAEYTSRAGGIDHSLVRLAAEQSQLKGEMAKALEEAERFKQQDKEFRELEPQRKDLNARLEELNASVEALGIWHASLQKLNSEQAQLVAERDELLEGEAALRVARNACDQSVDKALASLTSAQDRTLRSHIDTLSDEQSKAAHRMTIAEDNFAASKAAYEARSESGDSRKAEERARRQRRVQVTLSVLLPLVFVGAGMPLFIHGRQITSLSFTALGLILLVFAVLLAGAALVMLFRPNKEEETRQERLQNAHWVMTQDEKKLAICKASMNELDERIRSYLQQAGLGDAEGSLRRARTLLDEAKDARAENNLLAQKQQALDVRLSALRENLASIKQQQANLIKKAGVGNDEDALLALDAELARKTKQRTSLLEAFERTNRRYGELQQELAGAKTAKSFDELKLRYQQVRTRQNESAHDYARLLLAKRMLEMAIAAWESKSQPEVYRHASRLLKLMTQGRWVKVAMSPEGKLQVTDAVKTVRDPAHLSLGTCQQLYLSLRIALLLMADNVGRAIPILADDILVNFDAQRRRGAALALAELARTRQVILFTCHEEIANVLKEVDGNANVIEL